jgi:hypothetical protein
MLSMRGLWRKSIRMLRMQRYQETTGIDELPCAICGGTAVTWNYRSIVRGGIQVIEGSPVCEAHGQVRSREVAG